MNFEILTSLITCKNIKLFLVTIYPLNLEAAAKGQLISKAIYGLLTSPKNEEPNLFCLLFYSSRQTNQIPPFVFWENLRLVNLLFDFFWPLKEWREYGRSSIKNCKECASRIGCKRDGALKLIWKKHNAMRKWDSAWISIWSLKKLFNLSYKVTRESPNFLH